MTAFNKYHGAGNDFIIIDNRDDAFNPGNAELIKKICDRRFGIGADGLILIDRDPELDFRMAYFNSDGNESTMCGNGGRCASDFAMRAGIAGKKLTFRAIDGIHKAVSEGNIIRLQMNDINEIRLINGNYYINTGSPHYVVFTEKLDSFDVYNKGRELRRSADFMPGGTNVNFVEIEKSGIFVRTYERGVEDETLSCGTGVTASAIVSVLAGHFDTGPVNVRTRGGKLSVEFKITEEKKITNVWLCGPATFVFEGKINL